MSEHTYSAPFAGSEDEWLAWVNRLPGFQDLGMTCSALGPEDGTFHVETVPLTPNPNGAVNGGLVAALADMAAGGVAMRAAPSDHAVATATLLVTYERPAWPPLLLRARVTKQGRTLAFIDVTVHAADGRLANSAKATMMFLPVPAG